MLCSIHKPANCFQFFFLSTSLLFHLYLCNFPQICFGFLKKILWFFSMVFDGKSNRSISEPTLVQSLLYIKTNYPKIDPKWPCSFTNFVIPLPATYMTFPRQMLKFTTEIWMPVTLILSKVIFLSMWLVCFAHLNHFYQYYLCFREMTPSCWI